MNNDIQSVSKTLSEREKISAIIWLVIGILQCLSCVAIIAGVWNIIAAVNGFKRSKNVLTPWPGIVAFYDKMMTNIIIALIVNLLVGGVIGVAGAIYDMLLVRNYVLENKKVFEEAGL
ncbi:MAG: hypothetical protein E7591_10495 [Ruminococcaceae bacterium]|nr:hypothetical protein [Oscillospiraceae bacterium]